MKGKIMTEHDNADNYATGDDQSEPKPQLPGDVINLLRFADIMLTPGHGQVITTEGVSLSDPSSSTGCTITPLGLERAKTELDAMLDTLDDLTSKLADYERGVTELRDQLLRERHEARDRAASLRLQRDVQRDALRELYDGVSHIAFAARAAADADGSELLNFVDKLIAEHRDRASYAVTAGRQSVLVAEQTPN